MGDQRRARIRRLEGQLAGEGLVGYDAQRANSTTTLYIVHAERLDRDEYDGLHEGDCVHIAVAQAVVGSEHALITKTVHPLPWWWIVEWVRHHTGEFGWRSATWAETESEKFSIKGGFFEGEVIEPTKVVALCAKIELEIAQLDPDDARAFLADLGLGESGLDRVIRTTYDLLGYMSFFTVGDDECRAWSVPRGTSAQVAAGEIHSDIARGFIRAEVNSYEDLVAAGGEFAELRARGQLRLEGKDYVVRDGDVVFVGVGQPNLACNLAKRTHAPSLVMIYEAGVIGAEPARLPLSIGDPTLVSGSLSVVSMYDIFANYLQRGNVDVGFMGGAQIDRFGNINATVIGGYDHPKVRLPGSGGSQEIAAWANRCYVMTPHQKRRFPERVEFMTSAGFIGGRGGRENAGLRGGGMRAVVTDIGILEPDETGEMILTALHPGKSIEQAKENTGWDLKVAPELNTTERVTENELKILRQELDPTGIYLRGGG